MDETYHLMSGAEVKAYFEAEDARRYSAKAPVYAPEFDAALSLMIDALLPYVSSEARILDVGAGTGYLSRRVLDRLPGAYMTLLDFSKNMLSAADEVLATHPGHYETLCADFNHADLPKGAFEAVVSSFSIHYARGDGAYRALYRRLYKALSPGGVFACCDMVAGATEEWSQLAEQGWRSHLEAIFDRQTANSILKKYYIQDTPLSIQGHFTYLKQAGFGVVDLLWKRHNFAVYVARK